MGRRAGGAAELGFEDTRYFANGSKLVWLVLPEEESVWVVSPQAPLRAAVQGEAIDAGDVLPGFALPVENLFR